MSNDVVSNNLDEDKYASKDAKRLNAFQSQFSEFIDHADNTVLFTNPFNFPKEKINYLYRRELATRNSRSEVLLGL